MTNETAISDQDLVGNQFDPEVQKTTEKEVSKLKKENIRRVFGSGYGRIAMLVFGVAILLLIIISGAKLFGKKEEPRRQPDATGSMLDSPGTRAADPYAATDVEAQMRRERNNQAAEEANREGRPYIAPPVLKNNETGPKLGANDMASDRPVSKDAPPEQRQIDQGKAPPSPDYSAMQQQYDKAYAELKALREKLKAEDIQPQILVAMGKGWKGEPVPAFSSAGYALPDRTKAAQQAQQQPQQQQMAAAPNTPQPTTPSAQKTILLQAGDSCYATLDYGVNTDNPGNNVIASLWECKGIKQAKLLGKYEIKDQEISFSFDRLSVPGKQVIPVQAIAINEQTWATGMADDVDNHYFRRYGTTALAAILSGLGKAAAIPIGAISTVGYASSAQTTVVQEPMSTSRQMKIAVGEMGTQAAEQFKRQADATKPTIKTFSSKESQKGMGIIFLSDVIEEKK